MQQCVSWNSLVHVLQLKYFHKPEGSQRKIKMSVKSKSKLGGKKKKRWKTLENICKAS